MTLILTEEIELSEAAIALLKKMETEKIHTGFEKGQLIRKTDAFYELSSYKLVRDSGVSHYYTVYELSQKGKLALIAANKLL